MPDTPELLLSDLADLINGYCEHQSANVCKFEQLDSSIDNCNDLAELSIIMDKLAAVINERYDILRNFNNKFKLYISRIKLQILKSPEQAVDEDLLKILHDRLYKARNEFARLRNDAKLWTRQNGLVGKAARALDAEGILTDNIFSEAISYFK